MQELISLKEWMLCFVKTAPISVEVDRNETVGTDLVAMRFVFVDVDLNEAVVIKLVVTRSMLVEIALMEDVAIKFAVDLVSVQLEPVEAILTELMFDSYRARYSRMDVNEG